MASKIICFGETLWDMLPSGKLPGGAPMNVAIHLKYNQYDPIVISRVGEDNLGKELLDYLLQKNISTKYIQTDYVNQTGVVEVNVSNKQEVAYNIVEPAAWDFIPFDELAAQIVKQSDVFIYGSLAARHQTSRETLLQYLKNARFKVFDVNLRPPFYTPEWVQELLHQANIVKMNHQELEEIASWLGHQPDTQKNMQFIQQHFELEQVIVTRGEAGAAVLTHQGYMEQVGYKVEVEDTIGSGDAFLATYLHNYLRHLPVSICIQKACKVGAYVATQAGATPYYNPSDIDLIIKES